MVGMLYVVTLLGELRAHPAAQASGVLVRTTCRDRVTEVDALADDGLFTVAVPARADAAAADRFSRLFHRVLSLHFDVHGPDVTARVRGVRHRLPVDQRVNLPVALSLAARGVPALVHRYED